MSQDHTPITPNDDLSNHDVTNGESNQTAPHNPVMLQTCLKELNLKAGQWYVDGTFGAGGHTRALLEQGVKVLAIDRDNHAQQYTESLKDNINFRFVKGNFRDLASHLRRAGINEVAGVLLDLGVSSMQLDEADRGFAFRQDGPLDMRMDEASEVSAAEVVNNFSQEKLAWIFFKYGEERYSRRLARAVVEARHNQYITTTQQLADIIFKAYPRGPRKDHPARRSFQGLRIFVNDELAALTDALNMIENSLSDGGRMVVMSYHSLEDRIVKEHLRSSKRLQSVYKKPLVPSEQEISDNPRARSAKLRVAEASVINDILASGENSSGQTDEHENRDQEMGEQSDD